MKKIVIALFVAFLICPPCALACKMLVQFPEHLPLDSVKQYPNYFVVKIEEANGETYRGTLQEVLGPDQAAGQQVAVEFRAREEAHARCPLILRKGKTYLLRSQSPKPPLLISRFDGYNIAMDHEKFAAYVNDLKEARRANK